MKRKNYKVKVKLIFETTMDHSQTSMQKAQEDVNRVLTDYLKDKKITHDSIVLMEQIRVLDKSRLGSFLCSLNKEKLQEIDKALICSFQIDIASYIDNLIKKEERR